MNERIPKTEDGKIDWGRFMFEDPERAMTLRDDHVKQQMREEYLNAEAQRSWSKQFYRSYPQLDTTLGRQAVWDILKADFQKLKEMSLSESNAMIAEQAQKNLDRMKKEEQRHSEYAVYVGGPGMEGEPAKPPPVDDDFSLSSIIKQRRTGREEARRGVRYGTYKD